MSADDDEFLRLLALGGEIGLNVVQLEVVAIEGDAAGDSDVAECQ
jgi:hypothetical protein